MDKVKSGVKTSEFWLAVAGALIPVANKHLGLDIPTEGVLGTLGTIATYVLGRSIVKAAGK